MSQDKPLVYKEHALRYWEKGYVPIPINLKSSTGKGPYIKGWESYSYDKMAKETVEAYAEKYPDAGIGIVMGHQVREGYRIISIDVDDDEMVDVVKKAIGPYNVSKRGKKGLTIFARVAMDLSIGSKKFKRLDVDGRKMPKPSVEILGLKTQTVVPPSIHPDTHKPYVWLDNDLLDVDFLSLPEINEGTLIEIQAFCESKAKHYIELNTMTWLGVGGGGDTHDICVQAVAHLVATGWKDEHIIVRIERAKAEACERNGEKYDWPDAHKIIGEWIASARAKGFGDKKEKQGKRKEAMERMIASWAIEYMGGKDYVVTDRQGTLRRYKEGHWPMVDTKELKQTMLREFLDVGIKDVNNAMAVVHSFCYRPYFGKSDGLSPLEDPKRRRICMLNGTLDVISGEMGKHDPEDELTYQMPVEWDPTAECPTFDGFLAETFSDDMTKAACLTQFMGYSLVRDYSFQKLLCMVGAGGNGKGTVQRLWSSLMDPDTVGTVPFHKLADERNLTSLVGKLVNFSSEIKRFDQMSDNVIKQITGNDPITIRKLYNEPINNVYLDTRLVLSANDMPNTADGSEAMRRRLIILEYNNTPTKVDVNLDKKLVKERVGVLRKHLIPRLKELYQQEFFTVPESSARAVDEYLRENDPVLYWMHENCEKVTDMKEAEASRDLYADFQQFMDRVGFRYPISEVSWGKTLKNKGLPSIDKWIGGMNKNVKVRMLKLKNGNKF